MKRGFLVLILAATMAVLLAFAGMASAQDEPAESWSLTGADDPSVWGDYQGAPSEQTTAEDAPDGPTFSAATPSATVLLRQPPFPPTDVSLFIPQVYSEAPPLVPAGQTANDEATLRTQLRALLVKRFGSGSAQVSQGLAKFDAASTKEIVPHPRLRAALVALKGTAGEPAINGTLNGTYSKVFFGEPPAGDANAQVVFPDGQKPQIIFNNQFRYEDFRLLASTAAHEPLHRDPTAPNKEELIANAIDSLVYGQFLLESPSVATSGTELARSKNTELMARLNTRDANGNLRLFTSTGNIFPGGNFVPYFAAPWEPLGDSTPGNAVLKGEVRNVVGPNVALPATVDFDDETLILLDSTQNVFTDAQVVRLARILKLNVYPPSVTRYAPTGRTKDRTPNIAATVSDVETNLAKPNIKLFVDGKRKTTFAYDRSTDRLKYASGRLSFGKHTVRVVATDAQGKSGAKSWAFKVVR
jgi:hypothetical protein